MDGLWRRFNFIVNMALPNKKKSTGHSLSIIQWNARSIRLKFSELERYSSVTDIFILSETWLKKTKAMVLGSNSKLRQLHSIEVPPIVVNGVTIPYVKSAKCLELNLSQNLSWNNHVSLLSKKINLSLHSLKVRKNIFTVEIRKLLVSATILPLIDYWSLVLIDCTSENNLKLQRAINSSIRFILNFRKDEYVTPHRRNLGWLSVKCRRLYYMVCFFFKLLNEGKPMYLRNLLIEDADVRRSERLSAKKHTCFKLPNYTTTYSEKSFLVSVIKMWEELPIEIVNSSSLGVFKHRAFDYLLNLDY